MSGAMRLVWTRGRDGVRTCMTIYERDREAYSEDVVRRVVTANGRSIIEARVALPKVGALNGDGSVDRRARRGLGLWAEAPAAPVTLPKVSLRGVEDGQGGGLATASHMLRRDPSPRPSPARGEGEDAGRVILFSADSARRARNLALLRRIGAAWHRRGLFRDPRGDVAALDGGAA